MAFKYRGKDRTVESVTRRSRESSGNYESIVMQDVQMFKPAAGENQVRILPPTWDDVEKWGDGWEIAVFQHYGIGADNNSYLCLEKMKGGECPICAERGKTDDDDERDDLRVSKRMFCYMIDRNNEKAGPQVWSMPLQLFREINTRSVDRKTNGLILIDDPENGYDITFVREGEKLHTKYVAVEVSRDPTPIHDSEKKQDRWLDTIADLPLPDVLVYHDAEHIEKVLFGKGSSKPRRGRDDEDTETGEDKGRSRSRSSSRDRGGDDGEDDTPRSRRGSRGRDAEDTSESEDRGRSRRSRGDDDDDDDAGNARSSRRGRGNDDDDTADTEERGSRSRRGSRDADDDDDKGDEAPRSRRGRDDEDTETGGSSRGGGVERRRSSTRGDDDDDTETPSRSRRSRGDDADEEDEKPGRGRRGGAGKDKDEKEDKGGKGDEDESPSGRARAGLSRMRNRR